MFIVVVDLLLELCGVLGEVQVVVVRLALVLVLSLALLVDLLLALRGVLRLGEVQVCSTGSSRRSLWIRLAC